MPKAILIILTLAGFASGAEMEATDRLSVDGSSLFKSTAVFSGSVGIGTTGPSEKLEIQGGAKYTDSSEILQQSIRSYDEEDSDAMAARFSLWHQVSGSSFNKVYTFNISGSDPYFGTGIAFNPAIYQYFAIRYKTGANFNSGTTYSIMLGADQSSAVSFNIIPDGKWHTSVINVTTINSGNTVSNLRIDFPDSNAINGQVAYFSYIAVGNMGSGLDNIYSKAGSVGIGTTGPNKKLEVITPHQVNIDDEIRIGSYFLGNFCGLGMNYRINGVGTVSKHIVDYDEGTRYTDVTLDHGNVGIGTTGPTASLSVSNPTLDSSNGIANFYNTGLTEGQQNFLLVGKSAATAQSALFGYIYSATAGNAGASVSNWGDQIGGPTGGLFVRKGGNVGIGTTSPGEKLDIAGGNGRVGSGYSWLTNSDARYKTNITTLENALSKVLKLRGVKYDLKEEKDIVMGHGRHIGFIAQELEKEYPELVHTDERGYKSVSYDKMTSILLEAVKEQQKVIETMEARIRNLEK